MSAFIYGASRYGFSFSEAMGNVGPTLARKPPGLPTKLEDRQSVPEILFGIPVQIVKAGKLLLVLGIQCGLRPFSLVQQALITSTRMPPGSRSEAEIAAYTWLLSRDSEHTRNRWQRGLTDGSFHWVHRSDSRQCNATRKNTIRIRARFRLRALAPEENN